MTLGSMEVQKANVKELPTADKELSSANKGLPRDVIVVTIHLNQDDATTLTEVEGRRQGPECHMKELLFEDQPEGEP